MSLALNTRPTAVALEAAQNLRSLPTPSADEGVSTPAAMADRRGPLRPGRLLPARSRLKGGQVAQAIRAADGVLIAAAAWLAFDFSNPKGLWESPLAAITPFALSAALLVFSLASVGAYAFRTREPLAGHLGRIGGGFLLSVGILTLGLVIFRAPFKLWQGEGFWLCLAFAVVYSLHIWWWMSVRRMRRSGRLTPNVVVVGATRNAERLVESAIESGEVAILGIFDDRKGRTPGQLRGVPVLGDTSDLLGHRIMPFVDRIVITVTSSAQARVRTLVDRLSVLPNDITLFVDIGQSGDRAAALSRLADMPLAQVAGVRADDTRALVKRASDLVIGALATIVAAPVMAAVALAVRLDSPGPIFFRQSRQGFNNEEIVVWKFRSMRHDLRDERAVKQVHVGDRRVTRVGAFIRKTSLDELPQLLNVLKGEMSLVGPRPHSPHMKTGDVESARLVAEYAHRHRVKPGITGWAAIHGSRGPVDTPERVRQRVAFDIEYIERQSFWLDLQIMAMTIPCLIGDRQAAR